MNTFNKLLTLIAAGALIAACSTPGSTRDDGADATVEDRSTAAAETSSAGTDASAQMDPLQDPNSALAERVFYFDFDSAELGSHEREVIAAHASYLASNADQKVRLEGHADERGSREYNIGLGEQRAMAVRQLMLFQGAAADQIETISYGEERPAAMGRNEEAWTLNRRVEIVYQGGR